MPTPLTTTIDARAIVTERDATNGTVTGTVDTAEILPFAFTSTGNAPQFDAVQKSQFALGPADVNVNAGIAGDLVGLVITADAPFNFRFASGETLFANTRCVSLFAAPGFDLGYDAADWLISGNGATTANVIAYQWSR